MARMGRRHPWNLMWGWRRWSSEKRLPDLWQVKSRLAQGRNLNPWQWPSSTHCSSISSWAGHTHYTNPDTKNVNYCSVNGQGGNTCLELQSGYLEHGGTTERFFRSLLWRTQEEAGRPRLIKLWVQQRNRVGELSITPRSFNCWAPTVC